MLTTLRYYNGYDYGTYTDDLMDLFTYGTQAQTKKFFKSVLRFCDNGSEVAGELIGDIIDKLSELRTLVDIMSAGDAKKSELNRVNREIKRLEKAQELCKEVR